MVGANQRIASRISTSLREAFGQPVWKTRMQNFFLDRRNIIRNAVKGDGVLIGVIQNESRTRVIITRLTDGTRIDQVLRLLLQMNFERLLAGTRSVFGHQRVPEVALLIPREATLDMSVAKKCN